MEDLLYYLWIGLNFSWLFLLQLVLPLEIFCKIFYGSQWYSYWCWTGLLCGLYWKCNSFFFPPISHFLFKNCSVENSPPLSLDESVNTFFNFLFILGHFKSHHLNSEIRISIGKGVCQSCILSLCLFNLYAEYIMRNAGLEETQAGIKIARRNINNFNMQMTPPLGQKVKN